MTYKTILFFIVFIFSGLVLSAQVDTTRYFVKEGNLCNKEFADAYRKVKLLDEATQRYSYEEYFLDDTLKAKVYYLYNKFRSKTGTYTEYYKNGHKKAQGTYLSDGKKKEGVKVNTWFYWYENGSVKSEVLYGLDMATNNFNPFLISYWDTLGVKKVVDGNGDYSYNGKYLLSLDSIEEISFSGSVKHGRYVGLWKGFYADGTLYCEETYNEKEEVTAGKSYDHAGKIYTYTNIDVPAEYKGGDAEMMGFLLRNVNYPWKEQSNEIQGKVMVGFTIDKNGKVKDVKVTRSVTPGFDKEALRVVNMLHNFKPATFRGQATSIYYNVPIIYKLQD